MNPAGFVSKGHTLQYLLQQFWGHEYEAAHYCDLDPKTQPLPLARIKKVMKSDREVKMISSEAPILFAKACEIFISEITIRAWQHAEENRRRTLQRSDVSAALARSDQFDFLIDLLPRDDYIRPDPHLPQNNQNLSFNALANDPKFHSLMAASYQNTPLLVSPAIEAPISNSTTKKEPANRNVQFHQGNQHQAQN
ncbi:histone-fold-containing protein [Neoconidiobolus thromboides FSU 785]|nr:histone-fold-containing protein [Neoconidiobolus thromboides FSU 785]